MRLFVLQVVDIVQQQVAGYFVGSYIGARCCRDLKGVTWLCSVLVKNLDAKIERVFDISKFFRKKFKNIFFESVEK